MDPHATKKKEKNWISSDDAICRTYETRRTSKELARKSVEGVEFFFFIEGLAACYFGFTGGSGTN